MATKKKISWVSQIPFVGERLAKIERRPRVAVVTLSGVIGQGGMLSRGGLNLAGVAGNIEQAFDIPRLKAVALSINSPGGSPVQSALIAGRIRDLAKEKKIPVYAFCDDVAASGGYWL
ncbi:MAG: S49 family peptidase, partial [Proteobacteria bacterium]|nr:S49 family peptidase [Pseudomonadota bacterium]